MRWEPCGLVQMEAMRLGTLPIVAPTGGLKDTVEDLDCSIKPPDVCSRNVEESFRSGMVSKGLAQP